MTEDQRPKITMTKSELTSLLGMDSLVRSNSKSKAFNTMLDIISNYLSVMKNSSGGVTLPSSTSSTAGTASGSKSVSRAVPNSNATETTQASSTSFMSASRPT